MNIHNFYLFLLCLLSFLVSFLILHFILKKKYFYTLDIPNFRSSHQINIPSSGGIVFLISGLFISLLSGNLMTLACTPLGIIGYLDDRFNINALGRYFFQILTCALLMFLSNKLIFDSLSHSLITIFTIFIGSALINLINFMDGIDGLVASTMIFIFLPFAILESNYFFILIASMIAFLNFNRHPAKIFMGDIGSTYLGSILFGIIISFNSKSHSILNLLIASPLLLDSSFCIIRRLLAKENIFKAHKKHIYQRLFQFGLNHSEITLIYIVPTITLTFLFFFGNYLLISLNIILIIVLGCYLDRNVCVPFRKN